MPEGTVIAVCTSRNKEERNATVPQCQLVEDFGLEGGGHAGDWHRQVSLLAIESIDKMRASGLDVVPGDFAENLTTSGIELCTFPIGTQLLLESGACLQLTQIGKECHTRCTIYHQAGDCVMPKEGVFARVLNSGMVSSGDSIRALNGVLSQGSEE